MLRWYCSFCLAFLLGTVLTSRAQVFEPGYLVINGRDTLRGEVLNEFWEEPPKQVRFRSTASAPGVVYPAEALQSVYVSSGHLLRRETLPIDRLAQVQLAQLTRSTPRNQQPESLLVDVWVDGPASLLGVRLSEVQHFFVRREQQPYLEMTERKYLAERNGNQYIADANDYYSQLLRYFGDCAAAVTLLEKTDFTVPHLARLVQAYNLECSAARARGRETVRDRLNRPTVALQVGLTAGARYNSLKLMMQPNGSGPSGAEALHGLDADGRVHLQLGSYLDLLSPGRRLALHVAVVGATFGRRGTVTGGSNGPAGMYEWRGIHAASQFGMRGLLPLGTNYRLLLGLGYEINTFWNRTSHTNLPLSYSLAYNDGSFIYSDFHGTVLPYLEAGLRYRRYSLVSTMRVYQNDYLLYTQNSQSTTLTYTPWSLAVVFGYQLNRHSDQQPKQ